MGIAAAMWLAASAARGQVLVVDQTSGDFTEPIVNGTVIPANNLAQSFTPSLSAVGYVQFRTLKIQPGTTTVTLVVNLLEGTYNGPIISSTTPVLLLNDTLLGTFYFPDNIPVTPGQLYFFQPVLQSAGGLSIGYKSPSGYLGGDAWNNGVPSGGLADYWFREGVVVPEPSVAWLALLAAAGLTITKLPHRGRSR